MAETTVATDLADAQRRPPGAFGRFGKWLASERVFRLIPFVLVEGLFLSPS